MDIQEVTEKAIQAGYKVDNLTAKQNGGRRMTTFILHNANGKIVNAFKYYPSIEGVVFDALIIDAPSVAFADIRY